MMQVKTITQPSAIHGLGCFAVERIQQGNIVWRHVTGMDPEHPKGLCEYPDDARFINHSAEPNTSANAAGETVAMRDIEPGEEITEDYWQTVPELAERRMEWILGQRLEG